MSTVKEKELIEVYSIQQFGRRTSLKMKILVDVNRDFTDTDKRNISECAEKLVALLNGESMSIHPDTKKEAAEEKESLLALFEGREIFIEEIPNEYWPESYGNISPWFLVTTKLGRIKIGWRKRVINIDWEGSTIKRTTKEIFPNEDVTKGDKYIHAWGYEKAKEYINKLLQ